MKQKKKRKKCGMWIAYRKVIKIFPTMTIICCASFQNNFLNETKNRMNDSNSEWTNEQKKRGNFTCIILRSLSVMCVNRAKQGDIVCSRCWSTVTATTTATTAASHTTFVLLDVCSLWNLSQCKINTTIAIDTAHTHRERARDKRTKSRKKNLQWKLVHWMTVVRAAQMWCILCIY